MYNIKFAKDKNYGHFKNCDWWITNWSFIHTHKKILIIEIIQLNQQFSDQKSKIFGIPYRAKSNINKQKLSKWSFLQVTSLAFMFSAYKHKIFFYLFIIIYHKIKKAQKRAKTVKWSI